MNYIYCNGELYHFGIKGMKWGIRRYQKEDGSLTTAGKKRYSDDAHNSSSKPKLTHRQKLEAKYREKGMTPEEATKAASKRIKTEKIVAVTAGVTIAAAAAYAANKYVRAHTDKILKAGSKMQVIADTPDKNFDRAFYAAYKNGDRTKYKGIFAKNHLGGENVHQFTLNANKDVKIASRDKAAKAFADLYKNDPEFRKAFQDSNERMKFGTIDKLRKVLDKASGNMTDRQLNKHGYDAFNVGLANHDTNGSSIAKKFYDALKKQGYDAIEDINDQKYSGYKSKSPIIVFNKSDKIAVSEVKKMTEEAMRSNYGKAMFQLVAPEIAKIGATYTGVYVGTFYGAKKLSELADGKKSTKPIRSDGT